MRLTHVSLFTGIGGLDLAAEWAGFETVLQVEMDDYANKVLQKHWPNVSRVRDIRDVNRESVSGPVTVISGGFPCQPFSAAGKRGGRNDDRYLWPEMLRVIRELSPTWVVGENVAGLLSINDGMEIESIIVDLENEGYEVLPALYPAAGVGATHRRDRVFILANTAGVRLQGSGEKRNGIEGVSKGICSEPAGSGEQRTMADSGDVRRDRELGTVETKHDDRRGPKNGRGQWWAVEPDVGRVVDGISNRMDRLKCLGNAVVPQQAYPIFKAISEVEK